MKNQRAGLDDDYIIVLNAQNANTQHIEDLQYRYANDYDPLRLPGNFARKHATKARTPSRMPECIFPECDHRCGRLYFLGSPAIVIGLNGDRTV